MREIYFVFAIVASYGSAQANDAPLPDGWNGCTNEEYRPAKVNACAEVLNNTALSAEQRIIALYHHAPGLISRMQVGLANNDLILITSLDPKSEYVIKLRANIDETRAGAESLLHCLPKALCQ